MMRKLLYSFLFLFFAYSSFAQIVYTDNNSGTRSWTVPQGATEVTVEIWGAGGAGGGSQNNNRGGGGGGGGGYSSKTFSVTAGQNINYTIGTGGTGSINSGTNGGATSLTYTGANSLTANGGVRGIQSSSTGNAGGAGGTATGGTINLQGSSGGSGGSSGGNGGNSGNTTNTGGAGGTGVNGTSGFVPGGGGGGGERAGSDRSGGAGANGQVRITYIPSYQYQIISSNTGSTTWCAGETRNVTVTIKNTGSKAWTDTPSADFNIGIKWNPNGESWTDYNVRVDAQNLAPGETKTYTFTISAVYSGGDDNGTALPAGINNLAFDVVYEHVAWFGDNHNGVGPGNTLLKTVNQTIVALPLNRTTSAVLSSVCTGSGTNINVANSELGVSYQLRNGSVNIGTPVAGSNGTISLPTGNLTTATTFNVLATSACGSSLQMSNTPTVNVTPLPTTSNAGPDQTGNSSSFTLAGNAPTVGTGAWSVANGPSTLATQFSSTSNRTATFTPAASGTYVLNWTITNGTCTSTDQVVISTCLSNLIKNGDFSLGTTDWARATTKGTTVEVLTENVYFSNGNSDNTAELDSQASLRQDVTVVPGVQYTLSFLYARRPGSSPTVAVDVKLFGGSTASINYTTSDTNNTPFVGTLTFIPTTSSVGIEFYNSLETTTLGSIIDNIVLIPSSQVAPIAISSPKGNYKTLDVCAGVPVQLDVENVPTSGVTYVWSTTSSGAVFSSTTAKNPTVTFAGSGNEQKVTVVVTTAGGCSGTPSSTYFNVKAAPTVAAIGGGASTVCIGATTPAFTNSTAGGTWSILAGSGTASITSGGIVTGSTEGTVTVVYTVTAGNGCSNTATRSLTVNPNLPASVTIAASPSNVICSGASVTFTATPTNGGTAPSYQWYNGATAITNATNSTYTSTGLANSNVISVRMTSNATCATGSPAMSNQITMTVNPNLPASVTIAASPSNVICSGASVTFTATPTNGGTSPSYQWYNGATAITNATNSTYTSTGLANSNVISVRMTSNATCATGSPAMSNQITMTVNPNLPASVTIAASPSNVICSGASVTFTATPTNGGTSPSYQWYNGATAITNATNSTYTTTGLANSNVISVRMTSNATCATGSPATSNQITMTVNPNLPASVTIATSPSNVICSGASVTFTATPTNGGTAPSYQWYNGSTAITNETNSTYTSTGLSNADVITVRMTSNATCATGSPATSNGITMVVNPKPTTPSTSFTNVSCGNLGTITLSGLPSVNWTVNQTGQTVTTYNRQTNETTLTIENLQAGTYHFTVTNNDTSCISSTADVIISDLRTITEWNGSGWSNGNPDVNKTVRITSAASQPFSASTLNLTICSLEIAITGPDSLIIPSNMTLTVTNGITSNGKLVFESGSSLLQGDNAVNSGNISYKRKVSLTRYDVVYWASPVTDATMSMYKFSPNTLSDKYHYWNPNNETWVLNRNGPEIMKIGRGYSIRAPQSFDLATPSIFEGTFVGVPNNGDVTVTTVKDKLNMIGNPYPSAIDASELILETNKDVLGAIYIWSHNQPPQRVPGTNTFRYISSDFIVFNGVGSVRLDVVNGPLDEFDGYVGAGQSFFATPTVNEIKFNNALRKGSTDNTQFYKTAKTNKIEKNRLWLNIANTEGVFKQLLIGYMDGATNHNDLSYDAETMNSNSYIDFYTINESTNLTIQGRALPFDNTEVIPLGYRTGVDDKGDRNFTISIDHADGFFDTQEVYLEDKVTGKIIDLRKENYTFFSAATTNTTRFVLRYTNKTLGTGDFENLENSVLVSVKDKAVKITSSKETIKEVNIYNVGAQQLYSNNKVNASELQITNLHSSDQVILVKITLENGHTFTKKVVFSNL
ncbi:glycine-rich domain-containing protein [Flavobacterium sp. 3-218]